MISVYLVGPGGSGKTALQERLVESGRSLQYEVLTEVARKYMEEQNITQVDLKDQKLFRELQGGLAIRQFSCERKWHGHKHLISDRSVIDALVYAAQLRPKEFPSLGPCVGSDFASDNKENKNELHKFPNVGSMQAKQKGKGKSSSYYPGAKSHFPSDTEAKSRNHAEAKSDDHELAKNLLAPLLTSHVDYEMLGGNLDDIVGELIERYRRSLMVLVYPFTEKVPDDGVRKVMDASEIHEYTALCERVFRLLKIPFLSMKEKELPVRVEILRRAICERTLPSPLASLTYFENITSKKPDLETAEKLFRDVNFPFYLRQKDTLKEQKVPYPISHPSSYRIPCITLGESEMKFTFKDSPLGETNRFIEKYGTSKLFIIEFSMEVHAHIVRSLLSTGVYIRGRLYSLLGCSSSGLKARKCHLWEGTNQDAEDIRRHVGNFHEMKTIAKSMARFSLLLSNVFPTTVSPVHVVLEDDVEVGEYNFTDGCGSMSTDIAERLAHQVATNPSKTKQCYSEKKFGQQKHPSQKPPSVFQIRHQGHKGVLALNSRLELKTILVRPSMRKFNTDAFPNIYVCDHSRPFSFGHLNRQYIQLLSGLGVKDEVFLQIQKEHFQRVRDMLHDRDARMHIFEWLNRTNELLVPEDTLEEKQRQLTTLRQLQNKLVDESSRLRILVPESRSLFGVAETPQYCGETKRRMKGLLQSGECLVSLTLAGNQVKSLDNLSVVVSKNPCYLLGDIRILRAVSSKERPELRSLEKDLVDCIVFPIEGDRPHSDEVAGSDLDGDQYLVCWDKRLIPPKQAAPYAYPAYENLEDMSANAAVHNTKFVTNADTKAALMVDYVSIQNTVSSTMGRVDSLHRTWADKFGITCTECERLGQLFSRVVDSAKSGENVEIPKALLIPKKYRTEPSINSPFICQKMEYFAGEFRNEHQQRQARSGNLLLQRDKDDKSEDDCISVATTSEPNNSTSLLHLISRNHLAMSEFCKFKLIMSHFDADFDAFRRSPFAEYVNFGLFSAEEKGSVIRDHDVSPILLENAIRSHSRLLGSREDFLSKFSFGGKVPWQKFWQAYGTYHSGSEEWSYNGGNNRNSAFATMLAHGLRRHTDVMLVLEVADSVLFVLHFSRRVMGVEKANNFLSVKVPAAGVVENAITNGNNIVDHRVLSELMRVETFLISGHFGRFEKYVLDDEKYRITLSNSGGLQLYRGEKGQTFIHLKIDSEQSNSNGGFSLGKAAGKKGDGKQGKQKANSQSDKTHNPMSDSTKSVLASVDLGRFDRRIQNTDKKHPLVRKTPVYGVEMFVYSRETSFSEKASQKIAYLDILQESGDDPSNLYQDEEVLADEADDFTELMEVSVELKTMISDYNDRFPSLSPSERQASFLGILRSCHQRYSLCECLPPEFFEQVESIVNRVFGEISIGTVTWCYSTLEAIEFLGNAIPLLVDLDISIPAFTATSKSNPGSDGPSSVRILSDLVSSFVKLIRHWDVWLSLRDKKKRFRLLQWVEQKIQTLQEHLDTASDVSDSKDVFERNDLERLRFVFRQTSEQIRILFSEFESGSGTSDTLPQVTNLRIDPVEPVADFIDDADDDDDTEDKTHGDAEGETHEDTGGETHEDTGGETHEDTGGESHDDQGTKDDDERYVTQKTPPITFYRIEALPISARFQVGGYVCLSPQLPPVDKDEVRMDIQKQATLRNTNGLNDEEDFPTLAASVNKNAFGRKKGKQKVQPGKSSARSKPVGSCLARVVQLHEAPFSITVKIVSWSYAPYNVPDLLRLCLSKEKSAYWKIEVVPGNVILHMRILDVISAFLGGSKGGKHERLSISTTLLPYIFDHHYDETTDKDGNQCQADDPVEFAFPVPSLQNAIQPNVEQFQQLNEDQSLAVHRSQQYRVSMVHGPPGTGKTTTASQIIVNILRLAENGHRESGHRVLVCAETHVAVDNLVHRFLEVCPRSLLVNERPGSLLVDKASANEEPLREGWLPVLRIGGSGKRNHPGKQVSTMDISLETRVRVLAGLPATKHFFLSRYKSHIKQAIQQSRVVFTTCAGAGDSVLNGHEFKSVVMDEASLVTQPSALCALAHNCSHLVVIGDPKQLGPHAKVTSVDSLTNAESFFNRLEKRADQLKKAGLNRTVSRSLVKIFPPQPDQKELETCKDSSEYDAGDQGGDGCGHGEALKQEGNHNKNGNCDNESVVKAVHQADRFLIVQTMLTEQHRMHPTICAFPSNQFYDRRLKTGPLVEERTSIPQAFFKGKNPVRFVEVKNGQEERLRGGSWFNESEVAQIMKLLEELLGPSAALGLESNTFLLATQVTIITPYRAQQFKIHEQVLRLNWKIRPEVCSIDAFQGRENDVIIVSTVRCGDSLGFCDDENRLNVMLTRARCGLIVVGCRKTMLMSGIWKNWFAALDRSHRS